MKTARLTDLAIALPEKKRTSSAIEDVYSEVKKPTIRIHKRWLWVFCIVWLGLKITLLLFIYYKKEYNHISQQLQLQTTTAAASPK